MKYLFSLFLICLSFSPFAQQKHFIYIQADNRQPFYVRMDKDILSSSATGYLIIPKLVDSSYDLFIGFPKNEWPEQKVTCVVNNNDLGYLLKNFGEKGWGLFNFQTMDLVMANVKPQDDASLAVKNNDPFANALSDVVKDPKIKTQEVDTTELMVDLGKKKMDSATNKLKKAVARVKPKTNVKQNISTPVAQKDKISKIRSRKLADGLNVVYVDRVNGISDTVSVVFPVEPPVVKAKPEKKPVVKNVVKKDSTYDVLNAMKRAYEKKNRLDSLKKAKADALAADAAIRKTRTDSIAAAKKARIEELAAAKKAKEAAIAEAKKAKADSIAAVKQAKLDAIAAAKQAKLDAIAAAKKAAKEKADSLALASLQPNVPVPTNNPRIDSVISAQDTLGNIASSAAGKHEDVQPEEKKPVVEEKQPVVEAKQPIMEEKQPNAEEKKPVVEAKKPVEEPLVSRSPSNVEPVVCKYIADGDEFLSLKKKMSRAKSDNEMLFIAHQLFLKRCVSAKQIERLAVMFNNDMARYNLFDDAYHYCADKENFPALQSMLTDDYYIKRFKAMLR